MYLSFDPVATQKAEAAFAAAVRIRPSHANAQNNLGVLLSQRGALREAAAAFQLAIAHDPDAAAGTYANLGTALANSGQLTSAIAAFEAALQRDPGNAAFEQALATLRAHSSSQQP